MRCVGRLADSSVVKNATTCREPLLNNSKPSMGSQLSIEENAYSQLSRELKGQRGDYQKCLEEFVENVNQIYVISCSFC